jgi:hypothetical protein
LLLSDAAFELSAFYLCRLVQALFEVDLIPG